MQWQFNVTKKECKDGVRKTDEEESRRKIVSTDNWGTMPLQDRFLYQVSVKKVENINTSQKSNLNQEFWTAI